MDNPDLHNYHLCYAAACFLKDNPQLPWVAKLSEDIIRRIFAFADKLKPEFLPPKATSKARRTRRSQTVDVKEYPVEWVIDTARAQSAIRTADELIRGGFLQAGCDSKVEVLHPDLPDIGKRLETVSPNDPTPSSSAVTNADSNKSPVTPTTIKRDRRLLNRQHSPHSPHSPARMEGDDHEDADNRPNRNNNGPGPAPDENMQRRAMEIALAIRVVMEDNSVKDLIGNISNAARNIARPARPRPYASWKIQSVGYFNPDLPQLFGAGDCVTMSGDVHWRNVHLFIALVKQHSTDQDKRRAIQDNLPQLLRGEAQLCMVVFADTTVADTIAEVIAAVVGDTVAEAVDAATEEDNIGDTVTVTRIENTIATTIRAIADADAVATGAPGARGSRRIDDGYVLARAADMQALKTRCYEVLEQGEEEILVEYLDEDNTDNREAPRVVEIEDPAETQSKPADEELFITDDVFDTIIARPKELSPGKHSPPASYTYLNVDVLVGSSTETTFICLDTGCSTIIAGRPWVAAMAPEAPILIDKTLVVRGVGSRITMRERVKLMLRLLGLIDGVLKMGLFEVEAWFTDDLKPNLLLAVLFMNHTDKPVRIRRKTKMGIITDYDEAGLCMMTWSKASFAATAAAMLRHDSADAFDEALAALASETATDEDVWAALREGSEHPGHKPKDNKALTLGA
ncbi:hypothetical protein O1611_g2825 [Lasiodiplodia mahajangana]|uniref:Uncharacterized protein n=1 Tax=Lasiodiplodia mahajangana TaxID=1108764 RepID=A0ACC2JTH3_9PEZI|nr:hypothetical protein O1611_g2825 [Lasiodiplodia mahajangana]